jgi:hypothetical protein
VREIPAPLLFGIPAFFWLSANKIRIHANKLRIAANNGRFSANKPSFLANKQQIHANKPASKIKPAQEIPFLCRFSLF